MTETDQSPNAPALPVEQQSFWKRRPVKWLVKGVLYYIVVVLVLMFLQRSLIYHPTTGTAASLSTALESIPVEKKSTVTFETTDGITIHGWHFHSEINADSSQNFTALYFPGNAGNRSYRIEQVALLVSLGVDVLIFDYRGYGENGGKPAAKKFFSDALAAWSYAIEDAGIEADRILLFGESLGGGVAVHLAHELTVAGTPPAGMILQATFSSLADVAADHFPWLPVRWVLWERFPSVEFMPEVTSPYLHLHGTADHVVQYQFGKKLFDSAPEESGNGIPKTLETFENGDHNGLLLNFHGQFRKAVQTFLTKLKKKRA